MCSVLIYDVNSNRSERFTGFLVEDSTECNISVWLIIVWFKAANDTRTGTYTKKWTNASSNYERFGI